MQLLTQFLLTMLTNATVQQLILLGLREAAKRSDNTIDDQGRGHRRERLQNRVDPIKRAVEVVR